MYYIFLPLICVHLNVIKYNTQGKPFYLPSRFLFRLKFLLLLFFCIYLKCLSSDMHGARGKTRPFFLSLSPLLDLPVASFLVLSPLLLRFLYEEPRVCFFFFSFLFLFFSCSIVCKTLGNIFHLSINFKLLHGNCLYEF